jgi:hypothetical protein
MAEKSSNAIRLYSIANMAKLFRVSIWTIHYWIKNGKLKSDYYYVKGAGDYQTEVHLFTVETYERVRNDYLTGKQNPEHGNVSALPGKHE